LTAMSQLRAAEGRFDLIIASDPGITAIVDYAHTPDALKNVLETIKETKSNKANIVTVVGCGGDRDAEKRPVMARIAALMSDRLILTSDNPRSEDPAIILKEMEAGLSAEQLRNAMTIADREQAIKVACQLASPGDVVLVAGKGHEKYQEIKGQKIPFDDKAQLMASLGLN